MNRKIFFVAVALLAGTLVSCERENIPADFNNNGKVGVIVSGTEGIETKAGGSAEFLGSTLLEDIDGQDFRLDMYVEENNIMPFAEGVETKGSIVTTTSINKEGQKFAFNGWLGSTNRSDVDKDNYNFIPGATATKGASDWTLSEDYTWRNGVPSTFWSYYPTGTAGISLPGIVAADADQAKLTFAPTNVTGQQDILFAYNKQTVTYDVNGETEDDEFVNINFYHALAAIRFDVSGAIADGVTIKSISLKNVVVNGSCAVSGTASGNTPGIVSFVWTPGSTTSTLSESVAASDFKEKGLDGTTDNALMGLDSDKFLFVIPQAIKDTDIKLSITYTRADGTEATRESSLNHDPWKEGMIYTYKLNPAADVLKVEVVEGEVKDNVKNNVTVKNTGNIKAFFRVAIVGNWNVGDNATGAIIDKWTFDPSNTSEVTGFNTDWTLGTDGFYYYTKVVNPAETPVLFTKFTAPSHSNGTAHLEMHIIAQAIAAGTGTDYAAAWAAVLPTNE